VPATATPDAWQVAPDARVPAAGWPCSTGRSGGSRSPRCRLFPGRARAARCASSPRSSPQAFPFVFGFLFSQALGTEGFAASRVAALATREAKEKVDLPRLREDWKARAAEHGLGRRELEALVHDRPIERDRVEVEQLAVCVLGCDGLTEKRTTFTTPELVRAIAGSLPAGGSVNEVLEVADELSRFLGVELVEAQQVPGRPTPPSWGRRRVAAPPTSSKPQPALKAALCTDSSSTPTETAGSPIAACWSSTRREWLRRACSRRSSTQSTGRRGSCCCRRSGPVAGGRRRRALPGAVRPARRARTRREPATARPARTGSTRTNARGRSGALPRPRRRGWATRRQRQCDRRERAATRRLVAGSTARTHPQRDARLPPCRRRRTQPSRPRTR
jgi:hypothetical protein